MKNKNLIPYIFIFLFFAISILFPIIELVKNLNSVSLSDLVNSYQFKEALKNSIIITLIATTLSILLSYYLAYAISRTNIKHRSVLTVLLTLPMLIPSISHGLGLVNLFGQNGIITNFLGINFNIIGFNGILLGSILYSFPISFLMFTDAFNYVDNSMYEMAQVLGMSKFQTFKKITLYYMKKPLLSATFAIFTMIFTDYGVPLAVGGRYTTLPLFLYKEVIGLLDFSKGTLIGMFLLIPAFISFIFDLLSKDRVNNGFVNKEYVIKENSIIDKISKIIVYFVIIFLFILFGSFLYLSIIEKYPYNVSFSLSHFKYVFNNGVLKALLNSLLIAIITSIIGTIISYIVAYITARIGGKSSKILHVLVVVTLAIPGIVLGLSYMIAFKNTFIYRTYLILIMVNIVHFIASPYLIIYNALGKINKNYEIIGMTFGISRLRIIKDVIIPNSISTILEMLSYFFVNSMITISAVTFLFSVNTMPLSLVINQYEGQLMYEEAAIISLIILVFNLSLKLFVYLAKRKIYNKRGAVC